MIYESVSLKEAEQLTGLPQELIAALAECGELPANKVYGELHVGKAALLGWCRLFSKVLARIAEQAPRNQIGSYVSARSLTWMAQSGLLTGKNRIRL